MRWLVLAAVALLAMPMPAQAALVASGSVVAESLSVTEGFKQMGPGGFVHVDDLAGDATRFSFSIQASRASASIYTDSYDEVSGGPIRQSTRGMTSPLGGEPVRYDVDQAVLSLVDLQPDFTLNMQGHAGSSLVASGPALVSVSNNNPYLSNEGIRDGTSPPDAPVAASADGRFTRIKAAGPQIASSAPNAQLHLTGSFWVEFYGLTATLAGQQGTYRLESGRHIAPAAAGAPTDNVRHVRDGFVRLEVTDGDLWANVTATNRLQWTQDESTWSGKQFELAQVSGVVTLPDGREELMAGGNLELSGASRLTGSASEHGVRALITGLDPDGQPLLVATGTQARLPTGVILALSGGFAAAALILAWALSRRRSTMADVEAALEAGKYRAAARASSSILRRKPDSEDAVISRAIALSKAGRPQLVVTEVAAHLQARPPSDGVLHYVLGLAYFDLGKDEAGRQALHEAVRRTPGLAAQVQDKLGTPPLDAARDSPAYS